MASRRNLRSAAQAAQQENNAVADLDYFGTFTARYSKRHDKEGQRSRITPAQTSHENRARRVNKRTAAKRVHTEEPEGQVAPTRRSKRQRGDVVEEEYEEDEEDGVDHDFTAQAMNQAQHGPQRTVNGIGAHQGELSHEEEEEVEEEDEEEHEDNEYEEDEEQDEDKGKQIEAEGDDNLVMSRSSEEPRGQRSHASSHGNGHNPEPTRDSRALDLYEFQESSPEDLRRPKQKAVAGRRRITNRQTAPRQISQPNTIRRRPRAQDQESDDASVSSPEQGTRGINTVNMAEDPAFIEAPRPHEQLITVKAHINSLGGIIKTLQHQAWTNMARWDRTFERNDTTNGDVTACSTALGRALMKAIVGLKSLLERAVEAKQDYDGDGDEHDAAVDYLRERSTDARRHVARVNQAVHTICTEGLAYPPPAADANAAKQAIKTRQRLLRDITRRLIPMFILAVREACSLALTENHGSKLRIHFNSFTLQFFLRTLSWSTRVYNALVRGLQEWPIEAEFIRDKEDLHENEGRAEQAKIDARKAFGEQLSKLSIAAKDAERNIQEVADRAARQRREAIMLQRRMEQARLAQAAREHKEAEERQRKEKQLAAFARFTQSLRHNSDPRQHSSLRARATREGASRPSEHNIAPGPSTHSRGGQRASGTVRFEAGPSRADPSDDESEDIFDYDPYADKPSSNRNATSQQHAHNRPSGAGAAHQLSQASRPWLYEEGKTIVRAIRYDKTYNLASMAAELGRTEDDVARKVALLKQGYRAVYAKRRENIPAWAF